MKSMPKSSPEQELVKALDAAGAVEFLEYLQSGKRIMWLNFKAGVFKGLGVTVGMTLILGIIIWVLTLLVDLPIIGQYFADTQQFITEYADSTNYEDEFAEMNKLLSEINENTEEVISREEAISQELLPQD